MKNILYIKNKLKLALVVPVFSVSLILLSCEKESIDLTPPDRLTEASAFESVEKIELSMNGVYDAAQSGFYNAPDTTRVDRGYPFGAASVSQGDMRGEDMLNVASFYAYTYESTFNATSTLNNVYMWETLYGLINKANVVIEGVQNAAKAGIITAKKANEYEGECRFLRALAHHELLIHFARPYNETADASHYGVPYRIIPVNTPARVDEAKSQGRTSVKECYELLLQNLSFAETNLPATRIDKVTRATKGAAIALKTRVNLHRRDWDGVITEAQKIVSGDEAPFTSQIGGYLLTGVPEGPFANNKNNSESVFSILNSENDNPGTNGALPQMYSVSPNRVLVAISPIIFNATFWPANDLRRTTLTKSSSAGVFSNKYRDASSWSDNTPIIRYAEVLLNISEAITRSTGVTNKAVALLNAVRGRATDKVYTTSGDATAYTTIDNVSEMLMAIANERRVEFLGEGLRWKDIHRTAKTGEFGVSGVPAKVFYNETKITDWNAASGVVRPELLQNIPALPYTEDRFLWPIPTSETSTNPVLKDQQNPGF